MIIAEVVITHLLWDHPGMTHTTPDGKSIYFLIDRRLASISASEGESFKYMSDADIHEMVQEYTLELTKSN